MESIKKPIENKSLFIQCGCRNEIFVIEYDPEIQVADLAIYESFAGHRDKMSLWKRLRYCWQVLWHKKPYNDYMVLENKQLKELKDFLDSLSLG